MTQKYKNYHPTLFWWKNGTKIYSLPITRNGSQGHTNEFLKYPAFQLKGYGVNLRSVSLNKSIIEKCDAIFKVLSF